MEDAVASGHSEDSDYETDDECLIHVSVSGILQEDLSHLNNDQFSFLDIESERPLVTIGNQVFVGEYQDTVGTSVFFKQKDSSAPRDQVFSKKPSIEVKYFSDCRKKLVLKRVFLNKKQPVNGEPSEEKSGETENTSEK